MGLAWVRLLSAQHIVLEFFNLGMRSLIFTFTTASTQCIPGRDGNEAITLAGWNGHGAFLCGKGRKRERDMRDESVDL